MKAKPIILVVITLIIGFVLGMLTSAQIRFQKLKPVRVYFSEDRFRDGIYKTIEPDDQQKAKIDLVLSKYAKINSDLQTDFRRTFDSTMKNFRKELESNLTKDQLAKLKEMDERRQEMYRQGRKDRGDRGENDSTMNRGDRSHDMSGRPLPGGPPRNFERRDSARLPNRK
jgi:hypothetical protein